MRIEQKTGLAFHGKIPPPALSGSGSTGVISGIAFQRNVHHPGKMCYKTINDKQENMELSRIVRRLLFVVRRLLFVVRRLLFESVSTNYKLRTNLDNSMFSCLTLIVL